MAYKVVPAVGDAGEEGTSEDRQKWRSRCFRWHRPLPKGASANR